MYVEWIDPIADKFTVQTFVRLFKRLVRTNRDHAIQIIELLSEFVNEDDGCYEQGHAS